VTPAPRRYPLAEGSIPVADWPPALLSLMATTPTTVHEINVQSEWQVEGVALAWVVTFSGDELVAPFFERLPAWLAAHGMAGVTIRNARGLVPARYLDGPGLRATLIDTVLPSGAATWVWMRLTAAAVKADGSLSPDRRTELARRGCDVARPAPAGLGDLALAMRGAGAVGLETGLCDEGYGEDPFPVWQAVGYLRNDEDPLVILTALDRALRAAALQTMVSSWASWDSSWPAAIESFSTSYYLEVPMGILGGGWLSANVSRDPERPDEWRIEIRVPASAIGPDGRFLPEAP
jgi:hypothetical protein